jgi:putative membrane protein
MDSRRLFSAADEEAIRDAVAAAEKRSAGEVVPWIVEACDPYPEAGWKAAAVGVLLGVALGWGIHLVTAAWGGAPAYIAAAAVVCGGAGLLLGRLPAAKRLLVDGDVQAQRVRNAAEAAFLRAEVFATRERTGVLLFLALLERRVIVLGDSGISSRVRNEEWQQIVDNIVAGIRRGRAADALTAGIEACGRLLAERGVPIRPDDVNELPDRPRFDAH